MAGGIAGRGGGGGGGGVAGCGGGCGGGDDGGLFSCGEGLRVRDRGLGLLVVRIVGRVAAGVIGVAVFVRARGAVGIARESGDVDAYGQRRETLEAVGGGEGRTAEDGRDVAWGAPLEALGQRIVALVSGVVASPRDAVDVCAHVVGGIPSAVVDASARTVADGVEPTIDGGR